MGINLVQNGSNQYLSTSLPRTIDFGFGVQTTAGNCLIFTFLWGGGGGGLPSPTISDDAGNAYNVGFSNSYSFNDAIVKSWYALNALPCTIITVGNLSGGQTENPILLSGAEFSGVALSSALDGSANSNAGGTASKDPSIGSFTTSQNGCLIYAACCDGTIIMTPGSGFTALSGASSASPPESLGDEYKIQTTAGSINPNFSSGGVNCFWTGGGFALAPPRIVHSLPMMGMGR